MSRNTRFDENGHKRRSIFSPTHEGTRVPDGKPGKQRPLLTPDYFEDGPEYRGMVFGLGGL